MALAQRVQELNRYRSDFFGRLREILSDRENIRIVGDRFVFQSEVLFPSGGNELNPAGQEEMSKLAAALIDLAKEIPRRSTGSCASMAIRTMCRCRAMAAMSTNWELSSARATSVVKFLISKGVPRRPAGRGRLRPVSADRAW